MRHSVRDKPAAAAEVANAIAWYSQPEVKRAEAFVRDLERTEASRRPTPSCTSASRTRFDERFCVASYSLFYLIEQDLVVVLACMHQHQKPKTPRVARIMSRSTISSAIGGSVPYHADRIVVAVATKISRFSTPMEASERCLPPFHALAIVFGTECLDQRVGSRGHQVQRGADRLCKDVGHVDPLGHAATGLVGQPRIVGVDVDEFGAALDRETLAFRQRVRPRALSEMNR
jgi:hypothetical protein